MQMKECHLITKADIDLECDNCGNIISQGKKFICIDDTGNACSRFCAIKLNGGGTADYDL